MGVIEEITLVDFMCHKRLTVPLSPNVNFILGQNGSTWDTQSCVCVCVSSLPPLIPAPSLLAGVVQVGRVPL